MKKTILKVAGSGLVALAMLGSWVYASVTASPTTTVPQESTYAFTQAGQHPEQLLISTINKAQKNVDVAIYSITKYDIVDALVAAKKRGVSVRVITDRSESKTSSQAKELAYLKKYGIPIKMNTHSGIMHIKSTIVDGTYVTVGSYNYTTAASTTNDEVLVVLNDPQMASGFEQQFNRMWNDTKNFTNWK